MNDFGLKFHHLGLASKQEQRAISFLEGLGYVCGKKIYDKLQNVNLCLCEHDSMPTVEVVAPAHDSGPLESILAVAEASIYHICYETGDLDRSIELIRNQGQRVISVSYRKPAVLFKGRNVSFYQIRGLGLIELLEPA